MPATWLPSLHVLTGDVDNDTASLYTVFSRDFVRGNPTLEGLSISWDKNRDQGSVYDRGFVHLITRYTKSLMRGVSTTSGLKGCLGVGQY